MQKIFNLIIALTLFSFCLATSKGDIITVGALGDYGSAWKGASNASNELSVANLIKSWDPDFIITLGDNNYPYGQAASIDMNVGQFYHEYIHPYTGNFGAGAVSNRFFPTFGNHDWGFPVQTLAGGEPYLEYFTLPGNERYYSVRYGFVEMFALSSDDIEPDGNTTNSVQGAWLKSALAASTATWRLVYFHDAPYSSGQLHGTWTGESEGRKMNWPFNEWGASAVLTAHDHIYERVFTNGLTYFVCGTGGDRLDGVHYPLVAGSQTNITLVYGALRLDATETNLLFRFINVDGQVLDTYSIGNFNMPPAIAREPQSQQVPAGSDVTLSVVAEGSLPLSYQWFLNGPNAILGATNAALLLTNVGLSEAGDYLVVVSNGYGTATSAVATLIVEASPSLVLQPLSQEVSAGTDVTLRVSAVGQPPLRYQWFFAGPNAIPDATNDTLLIPDLQLAQAGNYYVVVSNDYGEDISALATLRVAGSLHEALDAPQLNWTSDLLWFGQAAVSHDGVDAAQNAPLAAGESAPLQAVILGPGLLRFWWKMSSANSSDVLSLTVSGNQVASLSGEVDWREEIFYLSSGIRLVRWQYDQAGDGHLGADAGWLDEVRFLSGETAPVITLQPADQTALAGSDVALHVAAVGTPTLRYQWYVNEVTPIGNGTNATLLLPAVQGADAGFYHVVVSNDRGATPSSPARLTISDPFRFSTTLLSNGWFHTSVRGVPAGSACVVEASTNLLGWAAVYTNDQSASQFDFSEPISSAQPARFYRALVR